MLRWTLADPRERAALAGAAAGIAGLAAFLLIHHLLILPIWFVAPVGAVVAALGGAAVGAAYHELRPKLPSAPLAAIGLMGAAALCLAPSFVLAELRGPVFDLMGSEAVLTVSWQVALWAFAGELLGGGAIVGAAIGWLLIRTRRAAVRCALAGVAFAIGLGHNVPFLGGTTGIPKELALITGAVVTAAVVLVALDRLLAPARRGRPATEKAAPNGYEPIN